MILNPITLSPDATLREAVNLMSRFKISGVPIVDADDRLVGIITNRDLQFERSLDRPVREAMTAKGLVTAPVGTTLDEAERILGEHRIEKLPVVDANGTLKGLITVKDIHKRRQYPNANKDQHGRLRVAAAIGASRRDLDRARALIDAGADVLVIDTAHGHSDGVLQATALVREAFPDVQLVVGNVATREGAARARRARRRCGEGRRRARLDLHDARRHGRRRSAAHGDLRCGRGGRRRSRDRRRRHQVFRRHREGARGGRVERDDGLDARRHGGEPGRVVPARGPPLQDDSRHGQPRAMQDGSADRYFQEGEMSPKKLVPEGIEGRVPYKGPVGDVLFQMVGGLRSGMGYVGCGTIDELRTRASSCASPPPGCASRTRTTSSSRARRRTTASSRDRESRNRESGVHLGMSLARRAASRGFSNDSPIPDCREL